MLIVFLALFLRFYVHLFISISAFISTSPFHSLFSPSLLHSAFISIAPFHCQSISSSLFYSTVFSTFHDWFSPLPPHAALIHFFISFYSSTTLFHFLPSLPFLNFTTSTLFQLLTSFWLVLNFLPLACMLI